MITTSLAPKRKLFYRAEEAAGVLHISVRHFRRVSDDLGIQPQRFGSSKIFFWLPKDIERIRNRKAA
jgi:hypothetical protein